MPYATEQDIRNEAFLNDVETVPSGQILQCLSMAHFEILNETLLTDESIPSGNVIRGEAILTISYFLRSLALSASVTAEHWKAGTLQVDGYEKVSNLMKMSQKLRDESWALLQAYRRVIVEPALLVVRSER